MIEAFPNSLEIQDPLMKNRKFYAQKRDTWVSWLPTVR